MITVVRGQLETAKRRRERRGVTLIELLVVISILSMLAAITLPALTAARAAARKAQCQNNMKQIGLGLISHATNRGRLPGGGADSIIIKNGAVTPQPRGFNKTPFLNERQTWGWAYQCLPYLDYKNRYLNPNDAAVRRSHVEFYICPARGPGLNGNGEAIGPAGPMHYAGSACSNCDAAGPSNPGPPQSKGPSRGRASQAGPAQDGVFVKTVARATNNKLVVISKPRALMSITDGLSQTVLCAEARELAAGQSCSRSTGWVSGYPVRSGTTVYGHDTLFSGRAGPPAVRETNAAIQCSPTAGAPHGMACNALFCDGSVRVISCEIDANLWRALLSVSGQEDVDLVAGQVLSP
jgi:prepilin-type N-terminal cleavage/methylation domain-containing protein/prepilin-type processing-associated H-X9-DG protein